MSNSKIFSPSTTNERRFLHFTMKISDRSAAKHFFCDILGMKILRHEEMGSGCEIQCNGNFLSPWSKTMVGYGDENQFFALELNYNYEVEGYRFGNDFSALKIRNRTAVEKCRTILDKKYFDQDANGDQPMLIRSPDGLRLILVDENVPEGEDPIEFLSLNVSNLEKSIDFYHRLLNMEMNREESNENRVRLFYGSKSNSSKEKSKANFRLDRQVQLELVSLNQPIQRATGYGRKAFSCPTSDVDRIEQLMKQENQKLYFEPTELGDDIEQNKVKVVILSDPDGHEICFVGEENYFNACQTNPNAAEIFNSQVEKKSGDSKKYQIGEDESNKKH